MLESAVRLPTPPPGVSYSPSHSVTRKRSPPSRSPSPRRRRRSPPPPPPDLPSTTRRDHRQDRRGDAGVGVGVGAVDRGRDRDDGRVPDERERQLMERLGRPTVKKPMSEEEKRSAEKAAYEKGLNTRAGGTYIPPARLRQLQSEITDKSSKEYQRMAWEALKKSVNGLINKVNVSNIKHIVPELFGENLIRGRGLFCRSIMKAQAASLPFTPIYAAMVAIVNTKLPQVGELLLNRLIVQFRKAFRRSDKAVCISSATFIAHLCNQQVVHEMLAAQILLLLLHKPTDDSVEIAVGLTREVGQHLEEMNGQIALAVFDQFRHILHEADIDKRVQYMIEVLFQVRKDHYKDNPAIKEELDLVEEEDQITHRIGLDDEIDVQDGLNVFKFDDKYIEHEDAYKKLKAEILGEESGSESESGSGSEEESSDEEEDEEERQMDIKDQSNTDLVNLRRTIYLTIMSSIDFEECVHKLMKITLPPDMEHELPSMIIECCSQERTYSKFFGLIGERLCKINRMWCDLFEESFAKYYDTIHRYETNRLRNIARFFGHVLSSDGIGWHVMSVIRLNENETTSSSRIFIKILFQDLAEELGLAKLQERLKDPILAPNYEGLFPKDNPRNTRFSINYFTSIGMGVLTEEMREYLKTLPKPIVPALPAKAPSRSRSPSVSSYSSYSSYTGSTRSRSLSGSRSPSRSPSPSRGRRRSRGRSYSRSITPSSRWSGSRSRTPSSRGKNYSRSRSPYSDRSRSRSRSVSSPPPSARRGRRRSPSASRSRSPLRSHSPSPPPPAVRRCSNRHDQPGRHGGRYRSISPSVSRSRSPSRSPSPPPRAGRNERHSYDAKPRRSARSVSASRSRSPSRSRTSPPPRPRHTSTMSNRLKEAGRRRSPLARSTSRSPSPPRRSHGRNNGGKSLDGVRREHRRRSSPSFAASRGNRRLPSVSPARQRNRAKASDFL